MENTAIRIDGEVKLGIAAKLGILLAAFGVLTSLLVGYYTYHATREILAKDANRELLQSTKVLGQRFSIMAGEAAKDVRFLAKIPHIRDHGGSGRVADAARQTLAMEFKSLLAEHPEYFQVRFISAHQQGIELVRVDRDGDGVKIVSGPDLQEKGHYPYVYETLKLTAGQVHFSKIFINREEGVHAGYKQPTLQVSSPVVGADGMVLGIVVLNVDLGRLFALLKSDLGRDYQLYLTNQSGDYLIHPDSAMTFGFDRGRRFLVQDAFAPVQAIVDAASDTAMVHTVSGQLKNDVIGGFTRIPFGDPSGHRFVIIGIAVPLDVVLAETDALVRNSSRIVFSFSLLAVILSILVAYVFVRPLNHLVWAVQHFAETRELTQVDVHSRDELGVLARSFMQMQEHILAHLSILNLRNDEMAGRARQDALTMAELKRLEELKREALTRLQKIASQVPGVVFQFRMRPDGGSCVPYTSDAIREIYRIDPEEVREDASKFFAHVHPDDLKSHLASIQASAHKLTPWQQEYRLAFDDGTVRWLFGNGLPQREADGATLWHGFITDITARKQAEAELIAAKQAAEDASSEKSRFLAAASHDLRQPIQAINLFNGALVRSGLNEEQKKISDYLSMSVSNLGELLDALLDISKLDAGAITPRPEAMPAEELFGRIEAEFSVLATQKSLRLKLFYPASGMTLYADPHLLMSMLANLIGNAIKYTERGGLLVGLRRRGNRGLIQVWDTGIGIAPEHLGDIFEEYFQVDNPARDRVRGLGLGLSIAKRLAKLLNAELRCRSRLGRGTVFEFSLPLAGEPERRQTPRIAQAHSGADVASSLAGRRIVVVEDDVNIADALDFSLTSLGMSVIAFGDAEAALASSEIAGADFYISDFRLPGISGLQLLDAIQQRSLGPINAVLLTGGVSPDSVQITQRSPWKVLLKPISLSQLLAVMEAQFSKR